MKVRSWGTGPSVLFRPIRPLHGMSPCTDVARSGGRAGHPTEKDILQSMVINLRYLIDEGEVYMIL